MTSLIHSTNIVHELKEFLHQASYSAFFILADDNTYRHCYPLMEQAFEIQPRLVIIPSGEESKDLWHCGYIWEKLLEANADRKACLINLGGGMITDLGGFAASVYKRGIPFIHIPSSLLGMVDAAIGGKTGIYFDSYKNIIDSFSFPEAVFIYPPFLNTLPEREKKAGYAEVLKYGLIYDTALWNKLYPVSFEQTEDWEKIIRRCIEIKEEIVREDPKEKGMRKVLNFGHTIGHALESFSLQHDENPLLHGEAVACGMLMEAYLSNRKTGLPEKQLKHIEEKIRGTFSYYSIKSESKDELIKLMQQDKKNEGGAIKFVLLKEIGESVFDISCTEEEILKAFEYYGSLWNG